MGYVVGKVAKLVPLLSVIALLVGMLGTAYGQSPGEPFARNPAKDINNLALNSNPYGIWSDGTTMWVADPIDNKIYAYNLSTKARDAAKDVNTLGGNPRGIWSDGTTMWVAHSSSGIVAYSMSTKARDAAKDFITTLDAAGNNTPYGIWSDGTTMWVTDWFDDKIYAYNMATKERDTAKDFNTLDTAGNNSSSGIWSDGTTMWVADVEDDKIYAYSMATKGRDSGKDFDTDTLAAAGNDLATGIWSDGTTLWVADGIDYKIYAYDLATKGRDSGKDFNTLNPVGNDAPQGIWSDGTTMWVAAHSADVKLYAYNLATKERDAAKDFNTLAVAGNEYPAGIWSDGTTMWVADGNDVKLYAYNLATKARDAAKDFNTSHFGYVAGSNPKGMWSDGTTMWVLFANDFLDYGFISAYNLATKARDDAKRFSTLGAAGHNHPRNIWSDGTTMWVSETAGIYAYDMATKQRDAARDFYPLRGAGGVVGFGIWSDGTTMWASDWWFDKIYAYNMPRTGTSTIGTPGKRTTGADDTDEPEPPPPSAVKAHCIADNEGDSEAGRIELGGVIKDRWIGGCPSVTGGGRLAKYYTFSIPHTATVEIALGSHFDDLLVLRRGDLGGTLVARDDDSGPGNDSRIYTTLPAGDYTVEATTFYVQGVEGDFTLSAYASDRILYSGYPGFASGEEISANLQGATYLDIRILPTLPLPTMQIWISDRDGFGPGQPGAAEKLLQGRIESDAGSPGSVMLAVPNGVWVDHGGITVETATSVGGEWKTHTAADEQKLLDGDGGIFGFLRKIASAATSLIGGSNPLETLAGWLQLMTGGQTMVEGETAAMLGLGESALSPIFQASYANCYSQISVPWLVEEKDVKEIVISLPVILTDSEYVSVGAEFIARQERARTEHSLIQAPRPAVHGPEHSILPAAVNGHGLRG